MRTTAVKGAAGVAAVVALGVAAGQAAGDNGLPTVPTVTVPAVTVPQVTAPKLPPVHVSAPAAPVPRVSAPSAPSTPSAPAVPSAGSSSVGSAYSGASGAAGTAAKTGSGSDRGASRRTPPRVTRLRASRPYISLDGKRTIRITFSLPRAGTIVFFVQQVSPVCRLAARVRVHAQAGSNAVTIGAKIGRRRLDVGTYRIVPRRAFVRGGRGITVVVVQSASPTGADVASARAENACASTAAGGSATYSYGTSGTTSGISGNGGSAAVGASTAKGRSGNAGGAPFKPRSQSPAGNGHARASGFVPTSGDGSDRMRPLLLAGVALATLLLALAAMPEAVARTSRFGEVVANRRLSLAVAGGATLVAFVLAYVVAGNGV